MDSCQMKRAILLLAFAGVVHATSISDVVLAIQQTLGTVACPTTCNQASVVAAITLLLNPPTTSVIDPTRVLILVNDAMPPETGTGTVGASVWVGQQYAVKRGVPTANIIHVSTGTGVRIEIAEFDAAIRPAVTAKLATEPYVAIVTTYGMPLIIGGTDASGLIAIDSLLAGISYTTATWASFNTYQGNDRFYPTNGVWQPMSPLPPHIQDAQPNIPVYVVGRLDGLSAVASISLVDKALAAESSPPSGTVCWDMQGSRHTDEWQWQVDSRMAAGAAYSQGKGFTTFLNRQASGASIAFDDPIPNVPHADGQTMSCPNASFAFGWYNYPQPGAYQWVNGGVGSQLISCNGGDLRVPWVNGSCNWTAMLIQSGAIGTWGTVDEPFAQNFPQGVNVFQFLSQGYTLGESFLLASPVVRWTTYLVGDPLYTPWRRP